MINKVFFERFTTEELELLNMYIEKVRNERIEMFPNSISESNVSIRCRTFLQQLSIYTWEQLVSYSENELLQLKNIGTKTLREIYIELEKRGLEFK